jgi:flagellar biosynthesis/type III secretory pathway M-ring protein FliF/YscJ
MATKQSYSKNIKNTDKVEKIESEIKEAKLKNYANGHPQQLAMLVKLLIKGEKVAGKK